MNIVGYISVFFSFALFASSLYYRGSDTGSFFGQPFNLGLCMFGVSLPVSILCFRLGIYIRDQTMTPPEYTVIIPILGFVLPTLLIGWIFTKKTDELIENGDLI